MRVNINLSVELEDVPLKVSTTLTDSYERLKSSAELVANASNNLLIEDDVAASLQNIKDTQKTIHSVFEDLNDMTQILVGYEKILLDMEHGPGSQLSLPLQTREEEDV